MTSAGRIGMGIGPRLLLTQAAVLLVVGITTWLVAAAVGPPLFHEHLQRAGMPDQSAGLLHSEEAYRSATAISIGVALGVAALTAMVVTAYYSGRLQRSVAEVSAAATAVADGRFDIRVSPPGLGGEFAELADAFNRMAQRLDAIDTGRRQMFGDLAHEIRTPVAVLDAYLEAIEDGVKSLDEQTTAVLRDQTRRLVRFSEDLSTLALAEEGRIAAAPTTVDPADLINAVLAAAADRYAAKGVRLSSRFAGRLPRISVDPQRIEQVLGNIVDNALRHTAAGGSVHVAAGADATAVTITVEDTGEGIAAEHLGHLFERFYRADGARDREHGGAGIGLAIAKAITEAHGGTITAASAGAGRGATFTVKLPLRAPMRSQ